MAKDFREWAESHCRLFGFADQNAKMVFAWKELFIAHGYDLDELSRATLALASEPPEKPWDHLGAIHKAIRAARAVVYRQEKAEEEFGECVLCGNTGRVVVPHIAGIKDGEWVPIATTRAGAGYYTMAVLCSCVVGQRHGSRLGTDRNGKPREMMTLEAYALRNPGWKSQMESRRRHQQAVAGVSRDVDNLNATEKQILKAKRLDTWWDGLKKRLAEKFKV